MYSQFGVLHVFDPATRATRAVRVTIAADMPQVRPHWLKVGTQIANAAISPTGVRALFEAHGSILTVPAEHGDIRTIAADSMSTASAPVAASFSRSAPCTMWSKPPGIRLNRAL